MLNIELSSNPEIVSIVASYCVPAGDQRSCVIARISQCSSDIRLGLQPELLTQLFDQLEPDNTVVNTWEVPVGPYNLGTSSLKRRN